MTNVLVDGHALSDGSQSRGIGTVLQRLLAGLARRPELRVKVIVSGGVALPAGVEPVPVRRLAPRRLRSLEHDLRLPRETAQLDGDVMYSPSQQPPRHIGLPWVQTLHDLIPLTRPDPLLERDRRRWLRVGPRLRQAAAVAAVSRFSADEAIRLLDLDPRRIEVIPNGVDLEVFSPKGPVEEAPVPYLLHVAAFGPHKGFREALEVIARLAERGLPHHLVLVGPQDEWMASQIRTLVMRSPRPDRVRVAGFVPDLPAIYRGATALLMSSRCEGFGLPALEAMACGTPVVSFANSSLTEVVGPGGVLVPDGDIDAMAGAVEAIVRDEQHRAALRSRGVVQAGRFPWQRAVDAYAELLLTVAR